MPQHFGAKLRYLRKQYGLTQAELARLLSLASYTYIHRLETDQRSPALPLVIQIAVFFDLSTDYLLRDSAPIEIVTNAHVELNENQQTQAAQFGAKLKALRSHVGWSQGDLARRLGLARQGYISNLEAGRKRPSPELAVQIADLFGVTTDYLLRDDIPLEAESKSDISQ
jgi:transcriptional regulator with XRE-family HTH domain